MNAPLNESEPHIDATVEPADTGDAQQVADEQFTHGLLTFMHKDSRAVQEARIGRLITQLRRTEIRRRPALLIRTSWRGVTSAAACVVLVATIALLGLPTEQSAQAMVQASIEASKQAGPRRYLVRAAVGRDDERLITEPVAQLDIRDPQHVVLRAVTRRGQRVIVGRNPDGEWAIRPDGTIERFDAGRAWPRWIEMSDQTLLLESVDALLEQLSRDYTVRRTSNDAPVNDVAAIEDDSPDDVDNADVAAPAARQRTFERISARRAGGPRHLPDRIELWIDPESRIVQRMMLVWNPWPRPPHIDGAGDDRPGDAAPGDGANRPRFGDRWRMRPPLNRNDGGHGDDTARAHYRRPQRNGDAPPSGEPNGEEVVGDGPQGPPANAMPRSPGEPLDRPGRPERGPWLDRRGPPPDGSGGGDDDRPERPLPPPRFLDGPPRFNDGKHQPPPRALIFQLVEAPGMADEWFEPETHVQP